MTPPLWYDRSTFRAQLDNFQQGPLQYWAAVIFFATLTVCLTSCLGYVPPSNVRLLLFLNCLFIGLAVILFGLTTGLLSWIEETDVVIFWAPAASAVLAYGVLFVFQRRRFFKQLAEVEGELPLRLLDGTIRLLNVSWLRAHDWRLVRHQELPPSAFLSAVDARSALSRSQVAALSYRWLSAEHPDPQSFHSLALRRADLPLPGRGVSGLFIEYAAPYPGCLAANQTP